MHKGDISGFPGREAGAELGDHARGVAAVIDGVGEPGDGEFELALTGGDVGGGGWVVGLGPVAWRVLSAGQQHFEEW